MEATDSHCFFLSAGEQNNKQGDLNTLSGAFETVMRVHYPASLGRIAIRMVPCPAVCVDAFSLVSKWVKHRFYCYPAVTRHVKLLLLCGKR